MMAVPVWGGVTFSSTGQKIRRIIEIIVGSRSGYYITSSLRPGDNGSHHGGTLSFGGSRTAAVDVGFGYQTSGYNERRQYLANALYQHSGLIVELISSGSPGYYVKNNSRVGAYAVADHYNHIHLALSDAQASVLLSRLSGSAPVPEMVADYNGTRYGDRAVLRRGDSGAAVGYLQKVGRALGYTIDEVAGSPFGPQTEAFVKSIQDKYDTAGGVDGVVGRETWSDIEYARHLRVSPDNRPVIRQGNNGTSGGSYCGYLQETLRLGGYSVDDVAGFPFGVQTHLAVKRFQEEYNVPNSVWSGAGDGIVGGDTWRAIDALRAGKIVKIPSPSPTPSPTPTTDPGAVAPAALLRFWKEINEAAPSAGLDGLKLGGILPSSATARGYHNSAARHLVWKKTQNGVNDYSVQKPPDREDPDSVYSSAIDLTGTVQTALMTKRLHEAILRNDPGLYALRECYGSLDNKVVYGRIKDSETGSYRVSSSDDSHLWHVHLSIFRKYANSWVHLEPILKILLGIREEPRDLQAILDDLSALPGGAPLVDELVAFLGL